MKIGTRTPLRRATPLLLIACTACGMAVKVTPLTSQKYPPTSPEAVKLYDRRPPGEWEQIARIEITGTENDDRNDTRDRARREAAQLGAEAIEIYGERTESRSAYIPPTQSSWTEYKSNSGFNYKIEHTQTTHGYTSHFTVPVCTYVGIRRRSGSGTDASSAPSFPCPKCSALWQYPSKDDVYECTCKQYMYVLSCFHCRKRFVLGQVGDTTCSDCRQATAVVLCRHCNHAQSAAQYTGLHSCMFCGQSWYSAICPGCRTPIAWDKYYEKDACPECKKEFDLPKPQKEEAIPKGYLGLSIQDLPPEDCERLKVRIGEAVVVTEVIEGSPAEKGGLRVGDAIVRIEDGAGGRWNGDRGVYLAWIQSKRPGTGITITILRNGEKLEARAVIGQRPD